MAKFLFNGMTTKELKKHLNIPADFRVDNVLGVPIKEIPRRYLVAILEGAIYEARFIRKEYDHARGIGEKLAAANKLPDDVIPAPEATK